jgi:dihydrofolate reductase
MGNMELWMQVSLDGFTEGPDHEVYWPIVDEELCESYLDKLSVTDVLLYGRKAYDIMAAFWPTADADPAISDFYVRFARFWKSITKIVFSNTLDTISWNTTVVSENMVEEIRAIRATPGRNGAIFGDADTAALLIKRDLIDDYHIFVHPVLLGDGLPLFPSFNRRADLMLVETRTFASSVIYLHYRRLAAGELARPGYMKIAG